MRAAAHTPRDGSDRWHDLATHLRATAELARTHADKFGAGELKSFRVKDFRSVNDSGVVEAGDRTALVGRNESGKTNLLLALAGLKPPGGMTEMTFVKDFPRDRMRDEFSEHATFLETTWELTNDEQKELTEIVPRARDVCEVRVGRRYKPQRWVSFPGLPALSVHTEVVVETLAVIRRSVNASLRGKDTGESSALKEAMAELAEALEDPGDPLEWARLAIEAVNTFRDAVSAVYPGILEKNDARLVSIEAHARDIQRDEAMVVVGLLAAFSLAGVAFAQGATTASAELRAPQGNPVGTAEFVEDPNGVSITVNITGGIEPG